MICGLPLYEYDHVFGYDEQRGHVADEITLLCDRHHKEKTNGLLPLADVIAANAQPYNVRTGVSSPYLLHFSGPECQIELGKSCSFSSLLGADLTSVVALAIWRKTIVGFTFDEGHLLLTVNLYHREGDEPEAKDRLVLAVDESELVYATDLWDVEFTGKNITVHQAHRHVALSMTLDPPGRVAIERGEFQFRGFEIHVLPDAIRSLWNNGRMWELHTRNIPNGIIVGDRSQPGEALVWFS